MFHGMATQNVFADDPRAAADWYAQVFGIEPYFQKEYAGAVAYVEFRVGDDEDEFGILDRRYVPGAADGGLSGGLVYWAVDDVEAEFARLLGLGATEHLPVTEQGEGFVTASVHDPFGNVLGVMLNQHFLDIAASHR